MAILHIYAIQCNFTVGSSWVASAS